MPTLLWGSGNAVLCQLSHECWRSNLRCAGSQRKPFAHGLMLSAISSGIALVTMKTFQGRLAMGNLSPKAAQHSKVLEMLGQFYVFGRD